MKPDLMNFTETYKLRAVKYLYSMSNENLVEILGAYKKEETFDNYSMVEKEAYVNTIKKHLTKLIKDDKPSVSSKYNECPRTLLCLVYCAGRAQSCFLTIPRIPSALPTRLAPASCTLHPEFYTP